jgi:hypothetical protein
VGKDTEYQRENESFQKYQTGIVQWGSSKESNAGVGRYPERNGVLIADYPHCGPHVETMRPGSVCYLLNTICVATQSHGSLAHHAHSITYYLRGHVQASLGLGFLAVG